MDTTFDSVMRALQTIRCGAVCTEEELHALASKAFEDAKIPVIHEARLGPRCRIDFLADGIGIEVKRGKPQKAALLKQCGRYLENEQLEALILVLDASVSLPRELHGKPLITFGLNKLWGVALP